MSLAYLSAAILPKYAIQWTKEHGAETFFRKGEDDRVVAFLNVTQWERDGGRFCNKILSSTFHVGNKFCIAPLQR